MAPLSYLSSAVAVLVIIYVVFRIAVRRSYREHGRLTWSSALLQYVGILSWVCFGYLNMPRGWPSVNVPLVQEIAGWVLFIGGFAMTLIGMVRLGVVQSHGLQANELRRAGMYRMSRNPQSVAFIAAIVGYVVLWPTWQNAGVLALVVVLTLLMILSEEEHLRSVFGEAYERYCKEVPRYLPPRPRNTQT